MSYVYLFDLHKLIDLKIEKLIQSLDDPENTIGQHRFQEGRMTALSDFKKFLTQTLNPKLPRRLRKINFEGESCSTKKPASHK